jgi:hypothetical protein
MANQLGSATVTPREYSSHKRRSSLARRRHDNQLGAFLAQQATRLSSTAAVIYAKLKKYKAVTIKAAASLANIP